MEVWMKLGNEKIFFNGKLARVVFPGDEGARKTGPGIAIRIIQIESKQEQILIDFIQERTSTKDEKKSENDTTLGQGFERLMS